MFEDIDDTIIQLSTPYAVSAIHIIRISGAKALEFLSHHTQLTNITPRKVYYTKFSNKNKIIDQIICYYFKTPASYSGEDMVEIHCHGSLLIVDKILKLGIKFGLRLATPGEFTKRAFLNGKKSIEQVEAIDSLIKAKSDYFRENALKILENEASLKFTDIKDEILTLISYLETSIEFPEHDTDDIFEQRNKLYQKYQNNLNKIISYFSKLSENFKKGKLLEHGLKVILAGKPNSGKSTLMNLLLKEERVLVSKTPGTTRDFVKEKITIGGFPILLHDTAGLRKTTNDIEKAGIKKTEQLFKTADLIIFIITKKTCYSEITKITQKYPHSKILYFINKKDKHTKESLIELKSFFSSQKIKISESLSLLSNKDLPKVEKVLLKTIQQNLQIHFDELSLLNERQNHIISTILKRLKLILKLLKQNESEEIVLEEFRELTGNFDEINISFSNEDLYDQIFKTFCLGK